MDNIILRKKVFIRFLKENNCYKQFCENFYNYQYCHEYIIDKLNIDKLIYRALINKTNGSEINDAFCWVNTEQEHKYWKDINDTWVHLSKFIKQIKYVKQKKNAVQISERK